MGIWGGIFGYIICSVGFPRFVFSTLMMKNKIKIKKNRKTGVDTMCDNKSLPVYHKACVPHCQIRLQLTTFNVAIVKHMTHQRSVGYF